jgi:membrane protein
MWGIVSETFREFIKDECPRLSASLAYYMFFSLPALLVAIVFISSLVLHGQEKAIEQGLRSHFEETIGPKGAEQIISILKNASQPKHGRRGLIVGMVMLLVGATGALQELQTALNRAWEVEPDPNQGGVRRFLIKRLISLLFLICIALLLIASVAVSIGLTTFSHWIDAHPSVWLSSRVIGWLHTLVSLVIVTLLFAVVLRFFPDAKVDWSDVWLGAIVTAGLFWLGQWLLGMYLTWSQPTSAYGAAGSLALVLLWMYYSAMIFFLGAEFTHVVATRRGKHAAPVAGAHRSATDSHATSNARASAS